MTEYPFHQWTSWQSTPMVSRVAEYAGQERIMVAATQFGDLGAAASRRVVDEWIEFFASGPSPIRELEFTTRTPKRLFEALRSQTQLEQLVLKWGDYADLDGLSGMPNLARLRLGGATAVVDLSPLSNLRSLRVLDIEGARRVLDHSELGHLKHLVDLRVGDAMWGPTLSTESLDFLLELKDLRALRWSPRVESRDYSPLLKLTWCDFIWLREYKGMKPPLEELASVRGIANAMALSHAAVVPVTDESTGALLYEIRHDKNGRPYSAAATQ